MPPYRSCVLEYLHYLIVVFVMLQIIGLSNTFQSWPENSEPEYNNEISLCRRPYEVAISESVHATNDLHTPKTANFQVKEVKPIIMETKLNLFGTNRFFDNEEEEDPKRSLPCNNPEDKVSFCTAGKQGIQKKDIQKLNTKSQWYYDHKPDEKILFPSEKYYIEKGRTPIIGLPNLGNTCYANTVMQILFWTMPFRRMILGIRNPKLSFLAALQELFNEMKNAEPRREISLKSFKNLPKNGLIGKYFDGYGHWAEKFLMDIFKSLNSMVETKEYLEEIFYFNDGSTLHDHLEVNLHKINDICTTVKSLLDHERVTRFSRILIIFVGNPFEMDVFTRIPEYLSSDLLARHNKRYELYGIAADVTYKSSTDMGDIIKPKDISHIMAVIKPEGYKNWFYIDDYRVQAIEDMNSVLENDSHQVRARMLFYQLKEINQLLDKDGK